MEEKFLQPICCYDNNDSALTAAVLASMNNRRDNGFAEAAVMNQQWNNPFAYLIWMMFANRFMGDYGMGSFFQGETTNRGKVIQIREFYYRYKRHAFKTP